MRGEKKEKKTSFLSWVSAKSIKIKVGAFSLRKKRAREYSAALNYKIKQQQYKQQEPVVYILNVFN